jgi:hypothetical protein
MAIPNGGKRNIIEAKIMKAEGVFAGAADLFIPLYNGYHYGLFIEMKYGNCKQTEAQKAFQDKVLHNGYAYIICRDIDEFMMKVNNYLTLKS